MNHFKTFAYRMQAKGSVGEIYIYEDVVPAGFEDYGVSALSFVQDLKSMGPLDRLDVHINSFGGELSSGTAIYSTLREFPGHVEVQINGNALSVASLIAMAGDHIRIAENGYMMIHNPATIAWGDGDALEKALRMVRLAEETTAKTYAARTGIPLDEIRSMMSSETWMSGPEAVRMGFADEVAPGLAMAASLDRIGMLARFSNVPEAVLAAAAQGAEEAPEAPVMAFPQVKAAKAEPGAAEQQTTEEPEPGAGYEPDAEERALIMQRERLEALSARV